VMETGVLIEDFIQYVYQINMAMAITDFLLRFFLILCYI